MLIKDSPFALFMAPEADKPSVEFINFILAMGRMSLAHNLEAVVLYNDKLQEMESLEFKKYKEFRFLFGLWPWQFSACCSLKKTGDVRKFHFAPLGSDFYLSQIELDLEPGYHTAALRLCGCALRTSPVEKPVLFILGNFLQETAEPQYIANSYLEKWPNLKEALNDFKRKVELFNYVADSPYASKGAKGSNEAVVGISGVCARYLKDLESYFSINFLPDTASQKEIAAIKNSLFKLEVKLDTHEQFNSATFTHPADFTYQKELEFACRRLNEREIILDGKRLWLLADALR